MADVKEEVDVFDTSGQGPDALPEEMLRVAENQPLDSEDSLSQEPVASELRRLNELRIGATLAGMRIGGASISNQNLEGGAVAPVAEESTVPMSTQSRQGAVAPDSEWNREENEAYPTHHKDQIDSWKTTISRSVRV